MMVQAFRQVGWIACVAAAALACYILSLQVAAERAELAKVERQIIATKISIRSLETELGTRGRLAQLERWNADVLALSAPKADQFLENEVTLARFDRNAPAMNPARVQFASADAAAATAKPMKAVVQDEAEVAPAAKVIRASFAAAEVVQAKPVIAAKVQKAAFIDPQLVSDIGAAAAAESAGRR